MNRHIFNPMVSELDRLKGRMHGRVQRAKKKGILIPQPCKVCGNPKSEAHHEVYFPPEIKWLCHKHHVRLHLDKKRGEGQKDVRHQDDR